MSLTLERTERPARAETRLRIIDSDIHPSLASPDALHPWLSAHWREHLMQYGTRPHGVYAGKGTYPRFTPNTARRDAGRRTASRRVPISPFCRSSIWMRTISRSAFSSR